MRKLQQSPRSRKRILLAAVFVPQHARHQADDRVDDHHGGHFAPVEDEVADRNMIRLQEEPDTFIKPFIAAAQEQDPLLAANRSTAGLVEPSPLRA